MQQRNYTDAQVIVQTLHSPCLATVCECHIKQMPRS